MIDYYNYLFVKNLENPIYKYPKKYEKYENIFIELLSQRLFVIKSAVSRMVPENHFGFVGFAAGLPSVLWPSWIICSQWHRVHEFFLLDQEVIIEYFIKEWKGNGADIKMLEKIRNSCDELHRKAIVTRDENIIQEII